MLFSVILVTIPTVLLNYILIRTLDMQVYIPLIIILYYFYLFSTIFLCLAGTSDPGIFERNYVSNMNNLGYF
jgi:hypothetical protein